MYFQILAAVSSDFPHSHSFLHKPTATSLHSQIATGTGLSGCSPDDLDSYAKCHTDNCAGATDFQKCSFTKCNPVTEMGPR